MNKFIFSVLFGLLFSQLEDEKLYVTIQMMDQVGIINTETNQEYDSEEHATNDVADPGTETKEEHLRRDVKIFAPSLADMVGGSDSD